MDSGSLVPQTEPLWVGMMNTGFAVSGRVVGWTTEGDSGPAPFPKADLPIPASPRPRMVVMVHATSADADMFGPVITVDADWPMRFVATAEEAWRVALELEAETRKKMDQQIRERSV